MTVAEGLREAARRLEPVSDTARLDTELLMAQALGVSRSDLLLRHTSDAVPRGFEELLQRRLQSEPVAYILGHQEFYGREFLVTPDVLVPRADSETTLEAALEAAPGVRRVLDCGVGSGALLLSYLAECPEACGIGIDRSLAALPVAAANAARLGLSSRCRMLRRDWNEAGWAQDLGKFDLVIANPPYVEENALLPRSVRNFEPAGALFSGELGLDDYHILVPQLPTLLVPSGVAVLEIGATQTGFVTQIAEGNGFSTTVRKDLAGRSRVIVLRLGLGNPSASG